MPEKNNCFADAGTGTNHDVGHKGADEARFVQKGKKLPNSFAQSMGNIGAS